MKMKNNELKFELKNFEIFKNCIKMSFRPRKGSRWKKKKMEGGRVIREFKLLPDSEAPIIGLPPPRKTSKRLHFKHPPSNYFFFRNKLNLLQKIN